MSRPQTPDDIMLALKLPFDPVLVKSRSQAGRTFSYITARTVMSRLDKVFGLDGWFDEYIPGESSVLCKLSIRLPDGSWITKQDAGGYAGMVDQGDDDKSGFSDALKRAAAKFGVGRYLSGEPDESVGDVGVSQPEMKQAAPLRSREEQPAERNQSPQPPKKYDGRLPTSGRALFAWTKQQEQDHQIGLLKYLNNWGKDQEFPVRMIDWDATQVALACQQATRKFAVIGVAASNDEGSDRQAGAIERPRDCPDAPTSGPNLYRALQEVDNELGSDFGRQAVASFGRECCNGRPMADWSREEVRDCWYWAWPSIAQTRKKTGKPQLSQDHRDLWQSATSYRVALGCPTDDASVWQFIQGRHVDLYQGEVMESFRDYQDQSRLREMTQKIKLDHETFDRDNAPKHVPDTDDDDIPF